MKIQCLTMCQGGCAQMMTPVITPTTMPTMMHDRQSMIVQGSLVDKPNEPKT